MPSVRVDLSFKGVSGILSEAALRSGYGELYDFVENFL